MLFFYTDEHYEPSKKDFDYTESFFTYVQPIPKNKEEPIPEPKKVEIFYDGRSFEEQIATQIDFDNFEVEIDDYMMPF